MHDLGGKVDEDLQTAWAAEIGKRIKSGFGDAKITRWGEIRKHNLPKLPHALALGIRLEQGANFLLHSTGASR
jgi:hypothetical protein